MPLDLPQIVSRSTTSIPGLSIRLTNPESLEVSSPLGMPRSLRTDVEKSSILLGIIATHHIKRRLAKIFRNSKTENPPNTEPAILLTPGYFGPNAYLERIARTTNLPIIRHPHFDQLRLKGNLEKEAQLYYEILKEREAPTVIIGHSRGGPTTLKALKALQDAGKDHLIEAVVLIAPISHGVREEVAQVLKHLPSRTLREMCPGSPALESWKNLSPKNRAKIVVVTAQDGDLFTSKENGFIQGSTLVVAPCNDGHLQQCIDPESLMFQTVIAIANAIGDEITGRPKRI